MCPGWVEILLDEKNDEINKGGRQQIAKCRSHWLDDIFVDQGWCWATERIEIDSDHADLMPLCLGRKSEIVPILRDDKPIPEDIHPRRRAILEEILRAKEREHERVSNLTVRATRLQRGRLVRHPRRVKRDA